MRHIGQNVLCKTHKKQTPKSIDKRGGEVRYHLDLSNAAEKAVYPLGENFQGDNGAGLKLDVTNTYVRLNGKPFFGVTGEAHYSRIAEDQFEDTILKMKMGGVNIVATYVFWIVHEEQEGVFRFDGNRNLRKFVQLCHKHGMYAIVRIGPFDHGEMRNGGLPDWLYGKPFECRTDSEGYLSCVRRLYEQIHRQLDGLYFDQGGPIIGVQVENEYQHSAAPWEITSGMSNEWIPAGRGGAQHMASLKALAKEVGIRAPFYTCTAWGGAITPDDMLPLWGGYAYWPWAFYAETNKPHPVTEEYIYRDNHNNAVPKTYNFEPRFAPESRPYACCEMMGGMFNSYNYRFILPFESVDALANIKLGSGCTLLGYYMYRGGTTPQGERTPFLNENQTPKLSYDFQAAIGEFGQLRPSWHRLRALHYFCATFQELLCQTRTVVPQWLEGLDPADQEKLRFSARVKSGSGFLFLNNFQDHAPMSDKTGDEIVLKLPDGGLVMEDLSLAAGENAVLPFRMDLDGVFLHYATAQPLTRLETEDGIYWFFFTPKGMTGRYHLQTRDGETQTYSPEAGKTSSFTLNTAGKPVTIVTLTREDSLNFYQFPVNGKETAFLSDSPLLLDGDSLRAETEGTSVTVMAFPPENMLKCLDGKTVQAVPAERDIFKGYTYQLDPQLCAVESVPAREVAPSRYTLEIPAGRLEGHKTALLRVRYAGDIGNAFLNGAIISDNFCNGAPWDIRMDPWKEQLERYPLTIYIAPLRQGAKVNVDSPMAARTELADGLAAELEGAELHFVNEITLIP